MQAKRFCLKLNKKKIILGELLETKKKVRENCEVS